MPMTRIVTGNARAITSRALDPGYSSDGPQSPLMTPLNHLKKRRYHGKSNPQAFIKRSMSAFLILGFSIRAAKGLGTSEKMANATIMTIRISGIIPKMRRIT